MIANDTSEQTTIPRGTTLETPEWRVHRYADHFKVTSLGNAGKRGKPCAVFTASAPSYESDAVLDARLDTIAPSLAFAARSSVSVESMRALIQDTALAGFAVRESAMRGIDVRRQPEIRLDSDLVRATFGETDALVTFTVVHSAPNGGSFREDTHVGTEKRADAIRVYQWAQNLDNRKRLVSMSAWEFRREMGAIGARVT